MPACSLAVPKIFVSHSHSQKLPAGTPTAWEPGYQDTDFLEPGHNLCDFSRDFAKIVDTL